MNAWKRSDWEHLPRDWGLNKAKSLVGVEIRMKGECLGRERKRSIEKEVRKWDLKCALTLNRKCNSMDRGIYRDSVEH